MEGQLWTYKTGTAGIPFWNSGGKIWVEFLINILLGRGLGHDRTKSVCRSRENGRLAHASFQNWHKAYCLDLSPSQSLRFQDSQGLSVNQLLHKYPIATSWVNNSFPVPITLTLCLQLGIHKLYHPLICHCSSPSLGDPSSSWYTWYSCFHNLSYFSFLGAKIQSFPQSSKSFLRFFRFSMPKNESTLLRLPLSTLSDKANGNKKGMGVSNFSPIPDFRPSHCPHTRISNSQPTPDEIIVSKNTMLKIT